MAASWTAADSLPLAVLLDPAMDIVEVHGETRSDLISVTFSFRFMHLIWPEAVVG